MSEGVEHLEGPHWDFSLAVYAEPGFAPACLDLQDSYGVDVNVLLLVLFAAVEHDVELDTNAIRAADAVVRDFREKVVMPLREIRRMLKVETALALPGGSKAVR